MDYVKEIRRDVGKRKIILNCAGVIIEKDGKILLQRRSDNGLWGFVGGILELNETYAEAAVREAMEETGLQVRLTSFLGIFHNHNMVWSNGDQAQCIGAIFIVGGALHVDEESLELRFFRREDFPPLFAPDHRAALECYDRGLRLPLLNENRYTDKENQT